MNCKICGAELKKPGELCNNCMNKLMKKEEARNDKKPYYKFKSEFILGYELLRHIEQVCIVIFMIVLLLSVNLSFWRYAVIIGCVFSMYGIIYLWYLRAKLNSVSCTLYKTKLVINYGVIKKKSKEISYDQIEEIFYTQGNMQALFKIGTVIIKKNSKNLLDRRDDIEPVRDIEKVFAKIKEVLE